MAKAQEVSQITTLPLPNSMTINGVAATELRLGVPSLFWKRTGL
jgi:hypothetical protein